MNSTPLLAGTFAVALCLTSPLQAAGQSIVSGDLAQLQGKWTSFTNIGGNTVRMVIEFKDNLVYTTRGDAKAPEAVQEVALDEETSPKQILLHHGKSLNVPEGSVFAKTGLPDMRSIYELKGETLTMCINIPGNKLPTKIGPGRGITMVVYTRGELTTPPGSSKAKGGAKAGEDDKTMALKAATMTKLARTTATLITADGREIPVVTNKMKAAYDTSGKITYDHAHFFHEGDVVDVTIINVATAGRHKWLISEARMVTQGTGPPAVESRSSHRETKQLRSTSTPPAQPLKRATVGKTFKDHIVVTIDGEEVKLYLNQPYASSYDAAGTLLPRRRANKLLREGNIVDVSFKEKAPTHPYYTLSEIHLVEGEIR